MKLPQGMEPEDIRSMQIEWGSGDTHVGDVHEQNAMTEPFVGTYAVTQQGIYIRTIHGNQLFYPHHVIHRFEAQPSEAERKELGR